MSAVQVSMAALMLMHIQNVPSQNQGQNVPGTKRPKRQNVPGTKRPKGQNVLRDKTSQGTKRPEGQNVPVTKRPRDKTSQGKKL